MLSHRLRNWRRQHLGSASAPEPRAPLNLIPAPSHLRLAGTSQAGVSRLGPSWQRCSPCGSSSPAAPPSSGLPVHALRAAAAAAARCQSRLLASLRLPRPGSPPSAPSLLLGLPARLSLLAVAPPPPRGRIWRRGTRRPKRPRASARTPAPGASGCVCPARAAASANACLPRAAQRRRPAGSARLWVGAWAPPSACVLSLCVRACGFVNARVPRRLVCPAPISPGGGGEPGHWWTEAAQPDQTPPVLLSF